MQIGYISLAAAGLVLLAGVAVGLSAPLTLFNFLSPGDFGATRLRHNIPYDQGPRRQLDIYAPRRAVRGALPVIVFLYGGSWNSGAKEDYGFVGKALAAKGFVVVVPDYRVVPEVVFPDFVADCAKAVAWTHANVRDFGGDPSKLFVMGHSAGAYNAAMLALDGRYLQAVGSKQSDVRGVATLAGPFDFAPFTVASTVAAFGGAPDSSITQPINYVSSSAPPMLLATGIDDTTVKPRNSRALSTLLEKAQRPVRLLEYPGVGHIGILLALSTALRRTAPVLDDVTKFFEMVAAED